MLNSVLNYVIMFLGIIIVIISFILIFIDRIKGEDIYINLDLKEQEMKKVIENANEIIAELSYTAEIAVREIEEKLKRVQFANSQEEGKSEVIVKEAKQVHIDKATQESKLNDFKINSKIMEKQKQVLEYASQGLNELEIAKRLDMGYGEVELILTLLKEEKNGQL